MFTATHCFQKYVGNFFLHVRVGSPTYTFWVQENIFSWTCNGKMKRKLCPLWIPLCIFGKHYCVTITVYLKLLTLKKKIPNKYFGHPKWCSFTRYVTNFFHSLHAKPFLQHMALDYMPCIEKTTNGLNDGLMAWCVIAVCDTLSLKSHVRQLTRWCRSNWWHSTTTSACTAAVSFSLLLVNQFCISATQVDTHDNGRDRMSYNTIGKCLVCPGMPTNSQLHLHCEPKKMWQYSWHYNSGKTRSFFIIFALL